MARVGKLAAAVELPSLQSRSPQLEKFKKVMEQSRREAARLEAIIEKRRVDMENRRAQIEHNKKKRQDEEMNKKMIIKKKMTKKVNKAPPVISSPVIDAELEANVTQPLLSVSEVSQLYSEAVVVPHSHSSFTINDSEGLVISQSSPSPLTVNQGVEDLVEVAAAAASKNSVEEPQLEAVAVVGVPNSGAAYHLKPQLEAEAVVGGSKSGVAYHSEPQFEVVKKSKTDGFVNKRKISNAAVPRNNKTGHPNASEIVPRGPLGLRREKNEAGMGPLAILMRKQAEVRRARTQSKPFEIEMKKLERDALKLKQEREKLEREREEEKLEQEEMARAIQEMSKGLKEIKMGLAFI